MSLPLKAVDRLFERLMATYGRDFMARYEGLELAAVKTVWAHELGGFADRLSDVAWALENLPARCPNVIEFRDLCRKAPRVELPQLDVKADPERVQSELAKLATARSVAAGGVDRKAWARSIMARVDAGERVRPICAKFARQALGIHAEEVQL